MTRADRQHDDVDAHAPKGDARTTPRDVAADRPAPQDVAADRPAPQDQDARDRIERDLHRNLLIEAGAGTGKTTVLVARIVALLRSGTVTIDQLVVITFTHRAATEIKGRVRTDLERALAQAGRGTTEHARVAAALTGLHRARVETIHAFATALLRQRPIEAGLDPQFEPLDAAASRRHFEDEFEAWRHGLLEREEPRLVRALRRGFDLGRLHDLASALSDHRAVLPLAKAAHDAPDPAPFRAAALDAAVAFQAAREACTDEQDQGFVQLDEATPYFDAFLDSDDVALEDLALITRPDLSSVAGKQDNYVPPTACKAMKASLKTFKAAADAYAGALRTATIVELLGLAEEFVAGAAEDRRKEGLVDFDDLLLRARDLLRGNETVRQAFRAQYRAVVIDEFQDTDPVQAELAMLLTCEHAPGTDWHEATLVPGALTVVGDPKQSIYRFRRADIAIYDRIKTGALGDGGEQISQNFRSRSRLLDWSNELFAPLLGDGDPGIQARHVDLVSTIGLEGDADAADAPGGGGESVGDRDGRPGGSAAVSGPEPTTGAARAPIVVLPGDGDAVSADQVRTQEADRIARLVRRAVEDEGWTVRDRGTEEERPARWRDVVVLMRTRAGSLGALEAAFARYGVPFRGSGGGGWYDAPEVRDLAHLLRAIDDPTDAFSVVGALRSAACGCSDDDLVRYRALDGRFDPQHPHPDAPPAVRDGFALIAGLHRLRHDLTLSELVGRTIEQSGLVPFALAGLGGSQSAANARQLLQMARATEGTAATGLRGFVRWIERQRRLELDEDHAGVSEDTDDVVRAMTMHGAKGLEFPIVVLAGLAGGQKPDASPIPFAAEHRIELKIGPAATAFATPGWGDAHAHEKTLLEAERKRLLYVAVTRARDHLVIPVIAPIEVPRKGKLLDWLGDALPEGGDPVVYGVTKDEVATADDDSPIGRLAALRSDGTDGVIGTHARAGWPHGPEDGDWAGAPWPGHDHVSVYPPGLLELVEARVAPGAEDAEEPAVDELAAERDAWEAARAATLLKAGRGRAIVAASSVHGGGADADRRRDDDLASGADDGAPRGTRATADVEDALVTPTGAVNQRAADVGSAVHRVMELVPLEDPELPLGPFVAQACAEWDVEDARDEVEELSRTCLRSPPVRRAAKADRSWRELAVVAQRGDATTLGRIDLLFEEAGELVLVDYKTDRIFDPEALRARHAGQMEAYGASLLAATGIALGSFELVGARNPGSGGA